MNNYEVNCNKKKSCKKASLKVHAFVSATGMYINLVPAKDKGQRGGGGGGERAVHKRTMGEVTVILRTRE